MKTLILLQKGPVFTVNLEKISQGVGVWIHLICNEKSYLQVCERGQQHFLKSVTLLTDFDFESLKAPIATLLQGHHLQTARLATNAEPLVAVTAQLREFFGIPGELSPVGECFTDKVKMKQSLAHHGIPVPRYATFDPNAYAQAPTSYLTSLTRNLSFPLIAKPNNAAGSVGVTPLKDANALTDWAKQAKTGTFELDEFIEGTLYHCDSFVFQGRVLYTAICEYGALPHTFMSGKNVGSITLPEDHPLFTPLCKFSENVISHFSTTLSGVTHLEVFVKPDGRFVFLEIAYRGGGVGIPKMYKKQLGVDLFSTHFILQCTEHYQWGYTPKGYAAWVMFSPLSGIYSLTDLPTVESEIHLIKKNPEITHNTICTSLREYTMSIFLWHECFNILLKDFQKLCAYETAL